MAMGDGTVMILGGLVLFTFALAVLAFSAVTLRRIVQTRRS
jgi:hypothetical protein